MDYIRTIPVIIGYKNSPTRADEDFIIGNGGVIKRVFHIIEGISAIIPEDFAKKIKKTTSVDYVEVDEKLYAHIPLTVYKEVQALKQITPWSIERIGSRLVNSLGNTGKGINISILDTGVDYFHEDLSSNCKKGYNYVNNDDKPLDDNFHGCCHPDTKIFTTQCGINNIKHFYDNYESEELTNNDGSTTKFLKDNIYTLSYKDDIVIKDKINTIHKIPIDRDDLIQINDLILTPWHKCFIFNQKTLKIEEKRADNVKIYDYLVSPGCFIEMNTEYRKDAKFLIDEDIAYLFGVLAGNGHVDLINKRIELSISSLDVANKCIGICNKLNFKITNPDLKENYYRLIIYNEDLTKYSYNNIKTLSTNARIPDIVTKSPYSVIISFISGLIDTDGNVQDSTHIRISSSSKEGIIDKIYNILSIMGVKVGITTLEESCHIWNDKLRCPNYQLNFHIEKIGDDLLKYMACKDKKEKLIIKKNKNNIIPITEKFLKNYITSKYGIEFNSYKHCCKCCGKIRLGSSRDIISKKRLIEIFEILNRKEDYLYNIANNFNFILVDKIKKKDYNGYFFDLTMDRSNNYIAGLSDMIFIHNTHVAGILSAEDNGVGVVGVAPDANLFPVKVLDYASTGTTSDLVAGLEWSLDNKMDIINMSLGSSFGSISVKNSCDAVYNAGILVVAAAGNNGNKEGKGDNVDDPAIYDSVIAVGATDRQDKRASFSSTGPKIEIVAPGSDICSTFPGNKYGILSGTSMASPIVAGVAALIKATDKKMTNGQVRIRLQMTTQNISKGISASVAKNWFGYGLVDAPRASSL